MSSENGWIPWNDRTDLACAYLEVTANWDDDVENFTVMGLYSVTKNGIRKRSDSRTMIYCLGRVPDKYLEKIKEKFWREEDTNSILVDVTNKPDEELEEVFKMIEYLHYCNNEGYDETYRKIKKIVRYYEELDRELFLHKEKFAPVSIPPAVPSAPVAAVQSDSNSPAVPDCLISAPFVASRKDIVTSCTAEVKPVENDQLKVLKQISNKLDRLKSIENGVHQIASTTASINMKIAGKISRLEDIPPYNPTVKNWVSVAKYAEITGISRENLDSMRSRGDNKAHDNNSGIHGEHCWRRVNDRVFYFVYQTQYLDLL